MPPGEGSGPKHQTMDLLLSNTAEVLRPAEVPPAEAPGLYVHVPFCFHKCHYCDFYSITRQTPERMARFVDLILHEADQWTRWAVKPFAEANPTCLHEAELWTRSAVRLRPKTIFFGGGTPSLLPLEEMRRLLLGLRERLDFSQVDEWTVEANPATVSLDYCQMLRESGVDRVSFGAQSFNLTELKLLERHHDPDDVPRSVAIARRAGFSRLNVDLIYAIPGQTLPSWSQSLDAAMALGTPHISCYGLTFEPNTAMTVRKRLGHFQAAEDSLEVEMMHYTRRHLTDAGLHPYEISNYAKAGEPCRHNLLYWTGGNYIGLGPSAASHVEGWRWKNRPHLGEWERTVAGGQLPAADLEKLTPQQRQGEWVMLRLRLSQGVAFNDYAARWGDDARTVYAGELERLAKLGLLEVTTGRFALSDAGLAVADGIACEFLRV